jgi:hypothetical protein
MAFIKNKLALLVMKPKDHLIERILDESLESAEISKGILETPQKNATRRYLLIPFEFMFFYIHLMNRVSLNKLGDEKRRRLHDLVVPVIFRTISKPFAIAIRGDGNKDIAVRNEHELEKVFYAKLTAAEIDYSSCTAYVTPENPLNNNALFYKLGLRVAEIVGFPRNEDLVKAVIGTAHKAFEKMRIVTLVEKAGKTL